MAIIAVGQLSLTDLNDAIVAVSEPPNPTDGLIWIDRSKTPNLIKRYSEAISDWEIIGEVSEEGTAETIINITETLGNMANDNIIDYNERQVIKDKITGIIGYIISDTDSAMPTANYLDSNGRGGFYTVRKSALNAGITSDNSVYVDVENKYNSLKSYLDGLTPVKAWDLSELNKDKNISVSKTVFRDRWLQYYLAVDALATATAEKLKQNVDDIRIGGRNFISNGDFSIPLSNARWKDYYYGQVQEIVDISTEAPPYQYSLHVNNTANGHGGIYYVPIFEGNVANKLVGTEVTIQFWIKYQNIVQGNADWNAGRFGELMIEGEDSSGTKVYSYHMVGGDYNYITGTNMEWTKHVGTIKIELPTNAVKLTKISFRHGLDNCKGEFWTTGLKLEQGNIATDWSDDPLDMQGRIVDVEQKITPEGIMTIVEASEKWMEQSDEVAILATKLNNVEQRLTPEGITTVISDSTFYENYINTLSKKADSSDLANYTTKGETELLQSELEGKIADAINGIDFEPYATKSELEETSKNITAKFSATGGMNLLRNSIGFAEFGTSEDDRNWIQLGTSSRLSRVNNDNDLDVLGFGSGFQWLAGTSTEWSAIDQKVNVSIGTPYTLSWYAQKSNSSSSSNDDGALLIQILEEISGVLTVVKEYKYDSEYTTNGEYEYGQFVNDQTLPKDMQQPSPYIPTRATAIVRVRANGLAIAKVTGLMLTIGDVALKWSLATGETYNTNVRLDINGIRVSQLNEDKVIIGYTQITPDEFAGFYSSDYGATFEKVFYLNGEETVTKKIRALEEFTMGTIKIIKYHNGWAFVPAIDE